MEHKVITHIECDTEWKAIGAYDSHRPLLWLANQRQESQLFFEYGMGDGSTKLLLNNLKNKLVSIEGDSEWANKYTFGYNEIWLDGYAVKRSLDGKHSVWQTDELFVKRYNDPNIYDPEPSVVFVDGKPGEMRKEIVKFYKWKAQVIILHDTEPGTQSIYGITEVLNSFKYRLDYYPEGMPGTTALSNFIDVTQWV